MKKRALTLFLTLVMVASLSTIHAAAAETITPTVSNCYLNFRSGAPIHTNLFQNNSGGLTRVEHHEVEDEPLIITDQNGNVVSYERRATPWVTVEEYDSQFQMTRSIRITPELPVWGGAFFGEKYNFLIYGARNMPEDDNAEVIRVVKYTKDWQRLGHASLRGANTTVPFASGSLRAAEYGDYLYIHTAHQMYATEDNLRHQANLTFAVQESTMEITDFAYHISNPSTGYVSHSFNQFVLVDSAGHLVTLDHGDGYPRGLRLARYYADADTGKFTSYTPNGICKVDVLVEFPGEIGDNSTGAVVGGLAETTNGYVVSYCYDGTGGAGGTHCPYLIYVDKQSGQIRNTPVASMEATAPFLVPTGPDGGYMLWNGTEDGQEDTLYYVTYNADGTTSPIQTVKASLYDCPPIYYNGKVVWYITDNSVPTFYTLDSSGITTHIAGGSAVLEEQTDTSSTPDPDLAPTNPTPDPNPVPGGTVSFSDVPTTHWAYPYINRAAEMGWVSGVGNNKFAPNDTLTFAEFYAMVVPVFAADELADYEAPAGSPWWQPYMWVGAWYLQAKTIWWETFYAGPNPELAPDYNQELQASIEKHANEPITRADAISIMWRVMGEDNATKHIPGVQDALEKLLSSGVELNAMYDDEVAVCYATGLISGDQNGDLNLYGTLTRAEGCTMLCNLVDYMLTYGWMSGTGDTIPFYLPESS